MLFKVSYYFSTFSVLIPIFLILISRLFLKNRLITNLGILVFLSALADLVSYLFLKESKPTAPVLNIYTMVEFYLISFLYITLYNYNNTSKFLIKLGVITFTGFILINGIFIQPIYEQQTWLFSIESVILLIFSIHYIYANTFRNSDNKVPINFTAFWINAGILFYFGLSLHLFVASNYIFKNMPADEAKFLWSFNNFNNGVKNIFFAAAIYLFLKKTQKSSSISYSVI